MQAKKPKGPKDKVPFGRIWALTRREWPLLVVAVVCSTAVGCVMPVFGLLFALILSALYKPRDQVQSAVQILVDLFVAGGFVSLIVTTLQASVWGRATGHGTRGQGRADKALGRAACRARYPRARNSRPARPLSFPTHARCYPQSTSPRFAQGGSLGIIAANLAMRLRSLLFRAFLRQDQAFFDVPEHSTGNLSTALTKDAFYVKVRA